MHEYRSNFAWIVAPLLLLVVCLGVYVGGYFYLCERELFFDGRSVRYYASEWQGNIFQPAAQIHSLFRDKPIMTGQAFKGGVPLVG